MTVMLLKANDETLLSKAVTEKVAELVGEGDASLIVEELTEDQHRMEDESFTLARLVDSAQTPPFLTDYRVVVGRHMGRFTKGTDVEGLVAYLESPLDSTNLLLVWEKGMSPRQDRLGAIPKSLVAAIEAAGGKVLDVGIPGGKGAKNWLDAQLKSATVRLDGAAKAAIIDRLGEERARVVALLSSLEAIYGADSVITAEQVEPFLGESGDVPPWELTDAIDSGRIDVALEKLHRMMGSGGRHPLQIMSTLQTHYLRMLRLDGAPISGEKQAAQLLGMKGSTFPAKKALTQTKKLGSANIKRAVELLAATDRGLRGEMGWPPELAMEVLVARLANLR